MSPPPRLGRSRPIIGLLYSTSFCRRDYLGDNAPAFEADLRRTLLALEPSGRFEQTIVFDCTLGFQPPVA